MANSTEIDLNVPFIQEEIQCHTAAVDNRDDNVSPSTKTFDLNVEFSQDNVDISPDITNIVEVDVDDTQDNVDRCQDLNPIVDVEDIQDGTTSSYTEVTDDRYTTISSDVDRANGAQEDESGSLLGRTGSSIDELYDLYCKHSRAVGFSVRKSTSRPSAEKGVVKEKYFLCGCSGLRKEKEVAPSIKPRKKMPLTRTGCLASVRIKKNGEGVYEIVNHVIAHNHPLNRREWTKYHRSERLITAEKGKAIEDMMMSGMRAMDSYRYMSHGAGGDESLGHTARDHLNYVNRIKMKFVEGGDSQKVNDMLHARAAKDENFFFRLLFDDESRLCGVFWRDELMMEDYDLFGDVVVFDTTYRTNKYDLICAPFVGINNHRRNVMFGCAFLANEQIESFRWLFEVFMKSMKGKSPKTIFTDQDHAIANATAKVFPNARHRLCLWHLHQKAITHYGQLKRNREFKDAFHRCLSGCDTEDEFEQCWWSTMKKYGLEEHDWFKHLYTLRWKWCTALSKDYFSAGIKSSQRSESTNHALGFKAKKTTNLTEFFVIFEDTITRWRKSEEQDEYNCSNKRPFSDVSLHGMLGHASKVYTLTMFEIFKIEFMNCMHAHCTIQHIEGNIMMYNVSRNGTGMQHSVIYNSVEKVVTCTCKKFDEMGILCYHCLRVLNINNVYEIPELYILRRWTKVSKKKMWDGDKDTVGFKSMDGFQWRHRMARKYYNFVLQCQDNKEARELIEESYNRDVAAISAMVVDSTTNEPTAEKNTSNVTILDPKKVKTKGRSKRKKGAMEKKKTKKKKGDDANGKTITEIGSNTPAPMRLF